MKVIAAIRRLEKFECEFPSKKRGLDENPAPFKIQYPMKNRNKSTQTSLLLIHFIVKDFQFF
jgi:hypothetical protein